MKNNINKIDNDQKKFLTFINFKDIDVWDIKTLKWRVEVNNFNKKYWKNINDCSIDELREALVFFQKLLSWYWNSVWNNNTNIWQWNHLTRRIWTVDTMKKQTLVKWLNIINGLDIDKVILVWREKIKEEQEKINMYNELYDSYEKIEKKED